jgi:pimeloyl-ACP methyl ester carboxylesterase
MHSRQTRGRLLRGIMILAIAAGGLEGCGWIDAKLRELIYRPTAGSVQDWRPVTPQDELLWIVLPPRGGAAPQGLRAIWVPQPKAAAPAVLYLHGTVRNLFENRSKIAAIHAAGYAVLAIDYRGYGDSTYVLPSEVTITEDVRAAWREFVQRVPVAARRVIYGHSLGGAAAIALASGLAPKAYGALVLEATFTSMPALVLDRYPWAGFVDILATQRFDSLDRIGQVDGPIWLLAGTADRTVPSAHSHQLFDAAPRACALVVFAGGSHSGLHREFSIAYRRVWRDIAAQLRLDAPPCPSDTRRIELIDGAAD